MNNHAGSLIFVGQFRSQGMNSSSTDSNIELLIPGNSHSTIKLAHFKGSLVTVKMARHVPIQAHDEAEMTAVKYLSHVIPVLQITCSLFVSA